jgi:hypothetical protein
MYIDYKELADFLSNIPQIANDWPELGKVLGTGAGICSLTRRQVNANILSINQAISDLLSDWYGRTGLFISTVSLLCYGSADSGGTGCTKGLKILGFDRVAGTHLCITE